MYLHGLVQSVYTFWLLGWVWRTGGGEKLAQRYPTTPMFEWTLWPLFEQTPRLLFEQTLEHHLPSTTSVICTSNPSSVTSAPSIHMLISSLNMLIYADFMIISDYMILQFI